MSALRPSPAPRKPPGRPAPAWLRRFLREERAATALEFALVAPPFLFMLLAIFELALVFAVNATLDSATAQASRLVRTGQAQQGGYTERMYETAVCSNLGWLSSMCDTSSDAAAGANNLYVDAEVKSSFAGSNPSSPIQNGAWNNGALKFNLGGSGDIIIIHTYFWWRMITPALWGGLQTIPSTAPGVVVVSATTTFRNEPY